MQFVKEQVEQQKVRQEQSNVPKFSSSQEASHQETPANRHLAFQKNYPKNIFIPLIEHLSQRGLRRQYEDCVGTRESFEGKNVVSLAEIHKVMSQEWFNQGINMTALVSNMSNKILMNSKIKKKLFHLLLIKELFAIPLQDAREFKKQVSKKANQVSQSKLPDDPLFQYPSALIYLLSLFALGLSGGQNSVEVRQFQQSLNSEDQTKNHQSKTRQKEISSKQEYKQYISRIITALNNYPPDPTRLLDTIELIKANITRREKEIRQKYHLSSLVPQWSYFNSIVINNCFTYKRNRTKLTYSLINQWIQEFKEMATSLKGFIEKSPPQAQNYQFQPIILVLPPF